MLVKLEFGTGLDFKPPSRSACLPEGQLHRRHLLTMTLLVIL